MKVLIIGGTGFIGDAVVQQASAEGHDVVLFNRGLSDPTSPYDVINGDVNNLTSFKDELLRIKPDVVVHTIADTKQHAKDLVSVFEGTKTQLIVLSSSDCYEAFQQINRAEDDSDYPIREEAQLSKLKHYWAHRAGHAGGKEYDKNLMTDVLTAAFKKGKVAPTVFRLPFVYGPKDKQYAYRHGAIIKHILDDQMDFVMSSTKQAQLYTYGYVENVAAAIVHSFGLQQTIGQIYNLGESDVRTRRRWADLYAENAGCQFTYHSLPLEIQSGRAEAPQNFILDTSKFREDTGFKEPVNLKESIKRTHEWAVQNPEALKEVVIDYRSEKALADLYQNFVKALNQKLRSPPPPKP